MHGNYPCLQLMHLGCSRLERYFLLVAQACKITTFTASLALELPSRTLETFYVLWITTLWTSISSLISLTRTKFYLVGWHLMIVFTYVPHVSLWSRLVRMLFLLALVWWEVCSLMSHQVHLSHLGVTCNLYYVICVRLWWLHLLSKLPNFAGNFSRSTLESLMVLETNSSSLSKKQNISICKILALSGGYLPRDTFLVQHCTTHL